MRLAIMHASTASGSQQRTLISFARGDLVEVTIAKPSGEGFRIRCAVVKGRA
jgi:hypothetical protein